LQLKGRDYFSYYEYETVEELPVVPPPATLTFSEERVLKVSSGGYSAVRKHNPPSPLSEMIFLTLPQNVYI
jgi:hypothetical protein